MKKLVEKIAHIVDYSHEIWECTDNDCIGCQVARGHARSGAREIIALLGKAYAEGELELPGEEWRGPAEDMDSVSLLTYDGIIIGLRREEEK